MLCKRIVPVMLVKGQTLAKGKQFNPWRSIGHARQAAMIHAKRGVDELMILDVAATAEGRGPDIDLVRELSEECFIPITVGGGVRSIDDIDALLRAGADKVAIGAAAMEVDGLIESAKDRFGAQAIVGIVNYKLRGLESMVCWRGEVKTVGGRVCWAASWAVELERMGAGEILLQCIDRDGELCGYDLNTLRGVVGSKYTRPAVSVPVIASCGAGTYQHMHEALEAGADAVAAGAMFAFTDSTPKGAAQYLKAKGWEMRCA